MRIALGQIDMGFEEKEKAMTLCSRLLAEAKEKQVDFVIFPEMTLTGFTLNPKSLHHSGRERESACRLCKNSSLLLRRRGKALYRR